MFTWGQWVQEVISRLTDKEPDNAAFTEAQAEYVKARMASELNYSADLYAIHQNRYTALRRKLVGFATTLNQAQQRTAVRDLITDTVPDNALFALACSYWVKAHLKGEINASPAEGQSWMQRYQAARMKLLGYQHTFANVAALRTAVNSLLLVDGAEDNATTFTHAHIDAAAADLQGLATWFNTQVEAAAADLRSLRMRVLKEIRAAVIAMQELIDPYREGQVSVLTEADGIAIGTRATQLTMPEQARLREAWVTWPDGDGVTLCRRAEAFLVRWEDRHREMLCGSRKCAQIAIDPGTRKLLVTPALVSGEIELELVWDGLKLSFGDGDPVTFDEGTANAAAHYVNGKMALELGDAITVSREYERAFLDAQQMLYLETRDRGSVAHAPIRRDERLRCGGCSNPDNLSDCMDGYEEMTVSASAAETLLIDAKHKNYGVRLTLLDGTAPYVFALTLEAITRKANNEISMLVGFPSSANPTLRIYDNEGTNLIDIVHDGVPGWFQATFKFNGNVWYLWGWNRVGT